MPPSTVETFADTAALPTGARLLLEEAEAAGLECGLDWLANLQQTVFDGDRTVRYYVAVREGTARAVLPVRLAKGPHSRTVESLANYYSALYAPAISAQCTVADLAGVLARSIADYRPHRITLRPMDSEAPSFALLEEAMRSVGLLVRRDPLFANWYLRVEGRWPDYLAHRPGALRSTLIRKGSKFVACGGTLEVVCTPERVAAGIAEFTDVYSRSWKEPEPFPRFVPGLAGWLARRGALRLGVARIAGRAVAAQLWMVAHGKASIFKLAHDESFKAAAPGTLLTAHLMQYVIENDEVQEVDFLMGDEAYKRMWMSYQRTRMALLGYRPLSPRSLLLMAADDMRRRRAQ